MVFPRARGCCPSSRMAAIAEKEKEAVTCMLPKEQKGGGDRGIISTLTGLLGHSSLISCFSSTSLIDFLRLTFKKHSTNPYTNPSLNLCEQAFEKHMVYYAEMPSSWPRFPAKRPNITSNIAVFLFLCL